MSTDFLSEEKILKYINQTPISLKVFKTLESTNKTAKQLAAEGADEGLLIVAEHQTAGRGRLGRSFYSPADTGLYFTLVLKPQLSPEDITLITAAAAVAVAETIEKEFAVPTYIKWVNDIFIKGKKVCGILCESAFNGDGTTAYSVLGIGINLAEPKDGFPDDIKDIAGGISKGVDSTVACRIIADTVNRFMYYYKDIGAVSFLEGYRNRLMLKGEKISFIKNGQTLTATLLDVDRRFRLEVINDEGQKEYLSTGEITIGSRQVGKKYDKT